jgi:Tol biopolymer transport system component
MANDRRRLTRARSLVLMVSLVAATACTAAVQDGSLASISVGPTVATTRETMRNGPLGVFGALDGVRALSVDGPGRALYWCRSCTDVTAADWSPDGTHLAFSNEDGLNLGDAADRTDRVVVVSPRIGDVAWSPDGSRIAYVDDGFRIITINPDGSGRTAIVGGTDIADLAWSPDGSQIAYSSIGGQLNVAGVYSRSKLGSLGLGEHPVWSPDGSRIAYFQAGGCAIRQLSSNERASLTLFDLTSVADHCDVGIDLAWSPDGSELAALVSREITTRKGVAAVYLVDAGGSGARRYTDWLASGWAWRGITWQPVP